MCEDLCFLIVVEAGAYDFQADSSSVRDKIVDCLISVSPNIRPFIHGNLFNTGNNDEYINDNVNGNENINKENIDDNDNGNDEDDQGGEPDVINNYSPSSSPPPPPSPLLSLSSSLSSPSSPSSHISSADAVSSSSTTTDDDDNTNINCDNDDNDNDNDDNVYCEMGGNYFDSTDDDRDTYGTSKKLYIRIPRSFTEDGHLRMGANTMGINTTAQMKFNERNWEESKFYIQTVDRNNVIVRANKKICQYYGGYCVSTDKLFQFDNLFEFYILSGMQKWISSLKYYFPNCSISTLDDDFEFTVCGPKKNNDEHFKYIIMMGGIYHVDNNC